MVGPDGTGKSTVCDALISGVFGDRPVLRVHHRFGVLPTRGGNTTDVTEPHAQQQYGTLASGLKTLTLFLDFWLGWLTQVRPFVRDGGWVLLERGWWDLAVDPRRYRLRPPTHLVRLLGRLLPRADLLLVLEAPAGTLLARKAELPEAELMAQMRAWHEVPPSRLRRVYIDTSAPLDEVIRRAELEIGRCLA